jgi:hypothetical protein
MGKKSNNNERVAAVLRIRGAITRKEENAYSKNPKMLLTL